MYDEEGVQKMSRSVGGGLAGELPALSMIAVECGEGFLGSTPDWFSPHGREHLGVGEKAVVFPLKATNRGALRTERLKVFQVCVQLDINRVSGFSEGG